MNFRFTFFGVWVTVALLIPRSDLRAQVSDSPRSPVSQARKHFESGQQVEAVRLCNVAARSKPDDPEIYKIRALAYVDYVDLHWDELEPERRLEIIRWVKQDVSKLSELKPGDPFSRLIQAVEINRHGFATERKERFQQAEAILAPLRGFSDSTTTRVDDRWRARVFLESAMASGMLNETTDQALDFAEKAVAFAPDWPLIYRYRAELFDALGEAERAATDLETLSKLKTDLSREPDLLKPSRE